MSATSSDVRKYTCIYGCVHNDAWGSPCESTVGCRITVPATFFLTRMAQEHATTWVHETSFCVLFLYGYIFIYIIYVYIKKSIQRHMYTYTHIRQVRLYLVEHPVCVIRCTAVEWQHAFAHLSRQNNRSRLQMFFSLLDSPLTPISHVLSAFKKNKKMSPYMYVNTRNRYVKYRAGTLIAVPVPTRNVRDNTRTRSKAFTLRSLYVHFACTITPKVCKFYVKK